jgi:hypothetical protein
MRPVRFSVPVLALCGCNALLGLHEGTPIPPLDAQYFDAPADAPFACPPIGAPPPEFTGASRVLPFECRNYQVNAATGRAVGRCTGAGQPDHIGEGPAHEPPMPIPGLSVGAGHHYAHPSMAPEGDELFYRHRDEGAGTTVIERQRRNPDGSWSLIGPLGPVIRSISLPGAPSFGPIRRMFVSNAEVGFDVTEIEIDASGTWRPIERYALFDDLGLFGLNGPISLLPDGLRMVFSGQTTDVIDKAFYASRPDLTSRFTTFHELVGVPPGSALNMTEDCARIYFWLPGSTLYVQQK